MSDLTTFRKDVREWLEENCPPSMRTPPGKGEVCWGGRNQDYLSTDQKLWLQRMGDKGWTAPTWPTEYGGGGLTSEEAEILSDEMGRINARSPLWSFGLWMIGPTLLEYGTEAQKKEHLPKMVRGEIRWCQGYSEPGAGSDLAGLQTKAVLDGDTFTVNGQKVWTSYADKADWIFALVRTKNDVKHAGITMLIFDMETTGVSTRPIELISGESPFCETFFDDVQVPADQIVGEVNGGWEVGMRLLQFERQNIGRDGFLSDDGAAQLASAAKAYVGEEDGQISDPSIRSRVAGVNMREAAVLTAFDRLADMAEAGEDVGALSSVLKILSAELNKDRFEAFIDIMGPAALGWDGDTFDQNELMICREWLRSKANSIEGGTTEINKNVIAKRVLGLKEHKAS